MPTVILPCRCENEYQDKRYGKGNRVHNTTFKGDKARCTSCLAMHDYKTPKADILKAT